MRPSFIFPFPLPFSFLKSQNPYLPQTPKPPNLKTKFKGEGGAEAAAAEKADKHRSKMLRRSLSRVPASPADSEKSLKVSLVAFLPFLLSCRLLCLPLARAGLACRLGKVAQGGRSGRTIKEIARKQLR